MFTHYCASNVGVGMPFSAKQMQMISWAFPKTFYLSVFGVTEARSNKVCLFVIDQSSVDYNRQVALECENYRNRFFYWKSLNDLDTWNVSIDRIDIMTFRNLILSIDEQFTVMPFRQIFS